MVRFWAMSEPTINESWKTLENYRAHCDQTKEWFVTPLSFEDWVKFNEALDAIDARHRG
jgi:hypothetical protein